MVKKTKGKHRLDKFYHLAKEQGYRSRAAFKLIQLNRKYDFLSGARRILDLCAAPGGWLQVAVKTMPVGSLILGVDLVAIKPIHGCKTFIGDITTQKCRAQVLKETGGALMDVVLHDGAPNVGGAWASEAYGQAWLTLEALKLATDVLTPKGIFVTKVFRSSDYTALLYALNQLFTKVESTKPAASRSASAEIFVVCRGYKAPSKIDPRLLDPKHLFKQVEEMPKAAGPDALLKTKVTQRRFREGYEEGISTTHKPISAAAFVVGDSPIEALGQHTGIDLAGAASEAPVPGLDDHLAVAEAIRSHPATTDEIRLLCQDLQVLGRSEFKQLLKWRMVVKKDLLKQQKEREKEEKKGDAAGSEEEESAEEEDPEDAILREMSDVRERLEKKRKKERRKRREAKTKSRVRTAQLAQSEGMGEDSFGMFTLSTLKGKGTAAALADAIAPESSDADSSSSDEGGADLADSEDNSDDDGSDSDGGIKQRRYDNEMEAYLEESYRAFKERQRQRDAAGDVPKKKRRRLGDDGELGDGAELEWKEPGSQEDDESEEEEEDVSEGGGLIVSLDDRQAGVPVSEEAAAVQWFAQDLFEGEDLMDEDAPLPAKKKKAHVDVVANGAVKAKAPAKANGRVQTIKAAAVPQESEDEEENSEEEEGDSDDGSDEEGAVDRQTNGHHRVGGGSSSGFEVVPLAGSDDSDSDDSDSAEEFNALDDNAKAEVMALAKKSLRRKGRDDIMEAAYNRYAFHDDAMPKWFAEDERRFMQPAPQISAEEFREAKDQLKAIDARPIKKVAEAKARKRNRLVARLQQARQRAEAVAAQEDMPSGAKMREIEKLYAAARSGSKGKKGAKGGKTKKLPRGAEYGKKRGPPLDSRLRKDRKGMERAAARIKGKGKGGAAGKKGRRK